MTAPPSAQTPEEDGLGSEPDDDADEEVDEDDEDTCGSVEFESESSGGVVAAAVELGWGLGVLSVMAAALCWCRWSQR